MWHLITIEQIPKVFRFAIFGMLTAILAAVTFKVYENLFFEGEAVNFNGGLIGIDNRHGKVRGAWSHYNNKLDWEDCLKQSTIFFEATSYIGNNSIAGSWTSAYIKDELIVFSCGKNSLDVFVASTDFSRAKLWRNRLRDDLKATSGKFGLVSK